MKSAQDVERITEILEQHEESPLVRLKNSTIRTDADYLELWFHVAELAYGKVSWIDDLIQRDTKAEEFERRIELKRVIRSRCESILSSRLSELEFQPRIEWYIDEIDPEERENFRRLLLAYLGRIYGGSTLRESLLELAEDFNIPRAYALRMAPDHPLFEDGVFEMEDSSYANEKPFPQRDLVFSSAIYNLFAGLNLSDADRAEIAGKHVALRFGAIDEETYLEATNRSEKARGDDFSDDVEDDEPLFTNSSSTDQYDGLQTLQELLRQEKQEEQAKTKDQANEPPSEPPADEIGDESGRAFEDDLDYLYSHYLWIKALDEAHEKAGEQMVLDEREHQRGLFDLQQKVRKQRTICELRLKKSREMDRLPRLERLADRLELHPLEKDVLKTLVGKSLFATGSRSLFGGVTIGELLRLLVDDPRKRVRERKIFRRSATLARTGLIHVEEKERLSGDLLDATVELDSRLIEYLTGEDYDITDYVQGSHLYRPTVSMDSVVLPETTKNDVLRRVDSFPRLLEAQQKLEQSAIGEYGRSLAMLFVGASGTGKTMLANAVAHHLGKPLLLFNFSSMSDRSSLSTPTVFSLLFREARMNDAILFFDESEALLTDRVSELLIEIERHEGMVIFATNASLEIEEAMRRRINLIVKFQEPGPALRKKIWQLHLPSHNADNARLDLDEISRKYELNGGLIRNAVFTAVSNAVHREDTVTSALTMEDLRVGAEDQLRNKLFMLNIHKAHVPEHGLDSVVLPDATLSAVKQVAQFIKSRRVLENEWGFSEMLANTRGMSVLFHGPHGTGKTITAEALAYESGMTVKRIGRSRLFELLSSGEEDIVEKILSEAVDGESMLLFDDADPLFDATAAIRRRPAYSSGAETLLRQVEAHGACAVFTAGVVEALDSTVLARLHAMIKFKPPNAGLRARIWSVLIPDRMPLAEDVQLGELSNRYSFAGADIRNAIVRAAAYQASASDGQRSVSMDDFVNACEEILSRTPNANARSVGFHTE